MKATTMNECSQIFVFSHISYFASYSRLPTCNDNLEPAMGNSFLSDFPSDRKRSKMAVEIAPLRSLQDFITDAQFTAPTSHDRDKMDYRMINNLIYYQTNYFLYAIIIFILVG